MWIKEADVITPAGEAGCDGTWVRVGSNFTFYSSVASESVSQSGLPPSYKVAQASLKLVIFLPQSPKCWVTGVRHHSQLI